MSFGECFEDIKVCTVTDVFGEGVPEGGGSYLEGSVAPGSVLVVEGEVSVRGTTVL